MAPPRDEQGYALVTILMLSVIIMSVTFSHAHQAVASAQVLDGSMRVQRVEESVASALAYVKRSVEQQATTQASLESPAGTTMDIQAAPLIDGYDAVRIDLADTGMQTSVHATARVVASQGEDLPTLTTAGHSAAMRPSAAVNVTADQTISDTTITGVVRLASGVELTLRDVVVEGTIVSHPMMVGSWTDAQRTRLVLDGGVLIRPGADLPDCAILMADGEVVTTADAKIDLRGTVVAREVGLAGLGAVHGDVISTATPTLATAVRQPGAGRTPRALPEVLELRSGRLTRLWFPTASASDAEITAIEGYSFPARGGDTTSSDTDSSRTLSTNTNVVR